MSVPLPLINRDRAEAVLDRFGVDALVLAEPLNIYHATGFWPMTLEMGQLGTSVAVVPGDRGQPVTLVTSQFLHYFHDIAAAPCGGELRAFLYTMADEHGVPAPARYLHEAEGGMPDRWERATRAATAEVLASAPASASAAAALRGALDSVPGGGRLAVDSFVPEAMLGAGFGYRPAEPLLRAIRMVKSPREIALMRHAAFNNAEAARAAVRSVRVGDAYETLRRAFFAETGRRGGQPVFLQVDSNAYAQRDGTIRDGRAFSIDAVGRYARYHGDFGRTVFVGSPDPLLRSAVDAAICANDAVAARLGPGLRYSDVTRIGHQAITDAGLNAVTPSSPHSVGLFHTDEAFADDAMVFAKADHLIEPGMVLSVDVPILQTDMGGTVHLEDLWLITETGCEVLNDRAEPFLQI